MAVGPVPRMGLGIESDFTAFQTVCAGTSCMLPEPPELYISLTLQDRTSSCRKMFACACTAGNRCPTAGIATLHSQSVRDNLVPIRWLVSVRDCEHGNYSRPHFKHTGSASRIAEWVHPACFTIASAAPMAEEHPGVAAGAS